MKVAVTGATGLLGVPLCAHLASRPNFEAVRVSRADWNSSQALIRAFADCEALIHLACINRASEAEVEAENRKLTDLLLGALPQTKIRTLLFASSVRAEREDAFGKSKRETESRLAEYGKSCNVRVRTLRLPNLFSETGRPFSNSVVATFAHQIVRGEKSEINTDSALEITDAHSASRWILSELEGTPGPLSTTRISIPELHAKMQTLWTGYLSGQIPPPVTPLDRPLFNVLRAHAFPRLYPMAATVRQDPRGHLFELFRARSEGQSFISSTQPGHTRGNHFHLEKFERFCVFSGKARILIRKLFTKETQSFDVDGANPSFVDIPTLHTHSITNIGSSPLWTVFYADEFFDPNRPDTFPEKVEDGRWLA